MLRQAIQIINDTATPLIDGVLRRAQHPKVLLDAIGMQVVTDMQNEIDTGGQGEWKPLRGRKGKALYNSGRLYRSLTFKSDPDAGEVAVGTNVKYAAYQQKGTGAHVIEAKRRKALAFQINGMTILRRKVLHPGIPARPFIRFPKPENEMAVIQRFVADYYEKGRE